MGGMIMTGAYLEVLGGKTTPRVNLSTVNLTRTGPISKPIFRAKKAVTNSLGIYMIKQHVSCFL
jgi:hypothetical protein